MKQLAVVALATAVGFAAGTYAGISYERHRPLPGPPAAFMAEFGGARAGAWEPHAINRAKLVEKIDSIRPQLDAFSKRIVEIDDQFSRDFEAVLNPEQKAKRAAEHNKRNHPSATAGTEPLTDDQILYIMHDEAVHDIAWEVVIPFHLDRLTREYKLDDNQREVVRGLLRQRRDQFLDLVDSSPPPSVNLSRLAPLVQRLAPVK